MTNDQNISIPLTPTNSQFAVEVPQANFWANFFAIGLSAFHFLSISTICFTNKLWLGEIPILALFQIPKAFLKSHIQQLWMSFNNAMGWTYGSHSPHYAATHDGSLIAATLLPAAALVLVFLGMKSFPRKPVLAIMIIFVISDTILSVWFDHNSHLKLFNGVF